MFIEQEVRIFGPWCEKMSTLTERVVLVPAAWRVGVLSSSSGALLMKHAQQLVPAAHREELHALCNVALCCRVLVLVGQG